MSELKPRITENGIDYILVGDYYIPDLKLPEEHRPIRSNNLKPFVNVKNVQIVIDGITIGITVGDISMWQTVQPIISVFF